MDDFPADHETLDRLLAARRSCRGFLDTPVPREVVERLLATAQRTPSWCNTQPWRVEVVSGDALKQVRDALVSAPGGAGTDLDFPVGYTGAHQERRRESGWQLYDAVGVERGDREASTREAMRNFEFFGAPHAAIVTSPVELGVYGTVDCGLYVETFLLAAQALGLGACAQAAIAARSPVLHQLLDLGGDRLVVCGIAFGYADPAHPSAGFRTRRVELTEVVTFVDELGAGHCGGGN